MNARINAPFTAAQVEALNKFQARDDIHPFTCPGDGWDQAVDCSDRNLRATTEGWVCACGRYTQTWAHAVMAVLP